MKNSGCMQLPLTPFIHQANVCDNSHRPLTEQAPCLPKCCDTRYCDASCCRCGIKL